jgi:hypothetical protein
MVVRIHSDPLQVAAQPELAGNVRVDNLAAKSVQPRQGLGSDPARRIDRGYSGIVLARDICPMIDSRPSDISTEITVEGAFFPAVLLYTGWWEGEHGDRLANQIDWRSDDDIKRWLFSGFEEWGPSWDLNPPQGSGDYLLGQIGSRDEADSIALIAAGEKASKLRERLASSSNAFSVRARGFLQPAQEITDAELRRRIEQWGKTFNYCVYVSPNEQGHFAEPHGEAQVLYSGYLWQCWLPESLAQYSGEVESGVKLLKPPRIDEVYFVWEHTNFARPDAVAYNLDSLRHKTEFLKSKHNDLILVQKSSALVEGEQALRQEDFYNFVTAPANRQVEP